jgi:hypothetical protein
MSVIEYNTALKFQNASGFAASQDTLMISGGKYKMKYAFINKLPLIVIL